MQRPGDEMGPFAAIAGAETAPTRKFGRHVFDIAALLRVSDILYNYRVWVVGVMGIEPIFSPKATPPICQIPSCNRSSFLRYSFESFIILAPVIF